LTQLMEFPQLAHRGILATVPAPPGVEGEITMTGAGFHASNGEPKVTSAGPRLSQHTDEVLGELGYDAAAIQALRDDDVI
jgi:formyl-CoA transferase